MPEVDNAGPSGREPGGDRCPVLAGADLHQQGRVAVDGAVVVQVAVVVAGRPRCAAGDLQEIHRTVGVDGGGRAREIDGLRTSATGGVVLDADVELERRLDGRGVLQEEYRAAS